MEHSLTSLLEIKRCARNLQIKPRANGRNIFGCYMLRMFAHPVACSVVLLGSSCCAKFEIDQTFSATMLGLVASVFT